MYVVLAFVGRTPLRIKKALLLLIEKNIHFFKKYLEGNHHHMIL
jgi:hypothetical protein